MIVDNPISVRHPFRRERDAVEVSGIISQVRTSLLCISKPSRIVIR